MNAWNERLLKRAELAGETAGRKSGRREIQGVAKDGVHLVLGSVRRWQARGQLGDMLKVPEASAASGTVARGESAGR